MTSMSGDHDPVDISKYTGRIPGLARREFLAALATAAAGAFVSVQGSLAQTPKHSSGWIDWHHHFGPPQWRSFLDSRRGGGQGGVFAPWRNWSPAQAVEELDHANAATAMVSITTPGIWLGENVATVEATRTLARECNDYGAKMRADYPGRFGLFAVLPLPDVEGSLREIEYAFDTLKTDGIGVLTSYGDKWLGDPAFAPVWEELNRRKAVVFTHPDIPYCCRGTATQRSLVPGVGGNLIEYGTDTTRTMMSLLASKADQRYPDVHFTFSHGGGVMPFLIGRILGRENLRALTDPSWHYVHTRDVQITLQQLRQFHYDTANVNNPVSLEALKQVVGASQIMVGTDFPYEGEVADQMNNLRGSGVFNAKELQAIGRENAEGLIPRLKSAS
jgi:6-methylsalicylate decarboxylase